MPAHFDMIEEFVDRMSSRFWFGGHVSYQLAEIMTVSSWELRAGTLFSWRAATRPAPRAYTNPHKSVFVRIGNIPARCGLTSGHLAMSNAWETGTNKGSTFTPTPRVLVA